MKSASLFMFCVFFCIKANAQNEKKVLMASTNFNIPMVQFTPITGSTSTKKGDVAFFNAVGAGVGISYADLQLIKNSKGDSIVQESKNKIGFQTGFLFSSNSSSSSNSNKFAWTMSLVILDFQIGYGYEFGTIDTNQKRNFFMLSYNIPLSKLTKGGSYVFRSKKSGRLQSKNDSPFFF